MPRRPEPSRDQVAFDALVEVASSHHGDGWTNDLADRAIEYARACNSHWAKLEERVAELEEQLRVMTADRDRAETCGDYADELRHRIALKEAADTVPTLMAERDAQQGRADTFAAVLAEIVGLLERDDPGIAEGRRTTKSDREVALSMAKSVLEYDGKLPPAPG